MKCSLGVSNFLEEISSLSHSIVFLYFFALITGLLKVLKKFCSLKARDSDKHNGVITHLEPDILEYEVKWALEIITTNKASGGDGIPVELFQILKDDAVKVLHSICQQIWKTH